MTTATTSSSHQLQLQQPCSADSSSSKTAGGTNPAKDNSNATMPLLQLPTATNTAHTTTTTRRIVKASTPRSSGGTKPAASSTKSKKNANMSSEVVDGDTVLLSRTAAATKGGAGGNSTSSSKKDAAAEAPDLQETLWLKHPDRLLPIPVAENVDVAREDTLDRIDADKQQRWESLQKRQRNHREKLMQEKRTTTTTTPKADATSAEDKKQDKSNLKANPMSRFLSAFSVEAHPEHKRKKPLGNQPNVAPGKDNDDVDQTQPSGKRLRPAPPQEDKDDNNKNSSRGINTNGESSNYSWSTVQIVSVVALVAAVTVAAVIKLASRKGGSKL